MANTSSLHIFYKMNIFNCHYYFFFFTFRLTFFYLVFLFFSEFNFLDKNVFVIYPVKKARTILVLFVFQSIKRKKKLPKLYKNESTDSNYPWKSKFDWFSCFLSPLYSIFWVGLRVNRITTNESTTFLCDQFSKRRTQLLRIFYYQAANGYSNSNIHYQFKWEEEKEAGVGGEKKTIAVKFWAAQWFVYFLNKCLFQLKCLSKCRNYSAILYQKRVKKQPKLLNID